MSTNIKFIAEWLYANPGTSNSAPIRKALCERNGKPWHRGWYCGYFATVGNYWDSHSHRYTHPSLKTCLWYKAEGTGEWVLTERGIELATS